jgi:hypothetical protein
MCVLDFSLYLSSSSGFIPTLPLSTHPFHIPLQPPPPLKKMKWLIPLSRGHQNIHFAAVFKLKIYQPIAFVWKGKKKENEKKRVRKRQDNLMFAYLSGV